MWRPLSMAVLSPNCVLVFHEGEDISWVDMVHAEFQLNDKVRGEEKSTDNSTICHVCRYSSGAQLRRKERYVTALCKRGSFSQIFSTSRKQREEAPNFTLRDVLNGSGGWLVTPGVSPRICLPLLLRRRELPLLSPLTAQEK